MVKSFPATYPLKTLWQENMGRASACNAGARAAAGNLLIFLDDDMEPSSHFVAAHERAHETNARLGVVGAAPILVDSESNPVIRHMGDKFNRHISRLARHGHKFSLRDFYSGNFSISRQIFLGISGFDEAFQVYGNEDLELSLRLTESGVELVFDEQCRAIQHYTKTFAQLARDTVDKGQTAVLLAGKHPTAYRELQLNSYHQESGRWLFLRGMLLICTRYWRGTLQLVILICGGLERRIPSHMSMIYRFSLDYFYWCGALSAIRRNRRMGVGLSSLAS
jgi:glycosyltransferase involved in cell wall biosynthesis